MVTAALLTVILVVPKQKQGLHTAFYFIISILISDAIYIFSFLKKLKAGRSTQSCSDLMFFYLILMLCWEILSTVLAVSNPVLVPTPENVFYSFFKLWRQMLLNCAYSFAILIPGYFAGMIFAVFLGLLAGWIPRFGNFFYPIANLMAPIPAVVFSPYLVAVMPSFRSASVLVIFLGVFWPNFLSSVNRVKNVDCRILDNAKILGLGRSEMVFSILLPAILPGIVSSLRVSLTSSLIMLNFAELMGATHGLGYFVQNSITYANYTHAVAGILCIALVVTLLNKITAGIETKAIPWR